MRLFLALREAAATRLFTHVPWLRAHLLATVEAYARGITIDVDQLEEAVRSIDPTDAAALQQALSGGVFAPHTTPQQQARARAARDRARARRGLGRRGGLRPPRCPTCRTPWRCAR